MDSPFDSLHAEEFEENEPHTAPFATLAAALREGDWEGPSGELTRGDRIHHYQIVKSLGLGGMGAIYLAEHIYLKQRVA